MIDYLDGIVMRVLRENPGEGEKSAERVARDFTALQLMMASIHPEYVNMGTKSFEEMEVEIRRETMQQEGTQLIGIFRFTE